MMNVTKRTSREPRFESDDDRWQAVLHRDRSADGLFYYSVSTTGVYCRVSCGARRPLRENVRYHASCAEAERAGFRACRRCCPGDADPAGQNAARIAVACRVIESADDQPPLAQLAMAAGLSRFHFHRLFTRLTGITPKQYALACQTERTRQALRRGRTVTESIYAAGFQSSSRFYSRAQRMLGMDSKRFRAGGRGETIRFAVGECSLGSVLVAATERGVCAILLGDEPDRLAKDLQDRFRQARLVGGDRAFERIVAQVVGLVDAPQAGFELPLDIRGTVFQQKVWNALRSIPPGATITYQKLARQLGLPKSSRAVAGACAANAIAVAIPCHRVVRTDGSLSGYRWGVERKRALLQREASARG